MIMLTLLKCSFSRVLKSLSQHFPFKLMVRKIFQVFSWLRLLIWVFMFSPSFNLPFSVSNKKFTKSLIKKLVVFTNNKFKFNIVWITMKSRSSFKLKITLKAIGNCSCGENYVSEPVRNVVLRWVEHKDPNEQLEPVKHFK